MNILYSKNYFLLTLLCLALIMGLLFWFGIRPLTRDIAERRNEVQQFHAERENRNRKLGQLSELRAEYEGVVKNEHLLDILIVDTEVVDFIKTVEAVAAGANVTAVITSQDKNAEIVEHGTQSVNPPRDSRGGQKEAASVPFDRYLPLSIEIAGAYQDIAQFIHKLETLPIALDIRSLALRPAIDESERESDRAERSPNPFMMTPGPETSETAMPVGIAVPEDLLATIQLFLYVDNKESGNQ